MERFELPYNFQFILNVRPMLYSILSILRCYLLLKLEILYILKHLDYLQSVSFIITGINASLLKSTINEN